MFQVPLFRITSFMALSFALILSFGVQAKKVPVIYDTDFAIDDWAAMLFLSLHSEVDLIGVTANGVGEGRCEPAMKNIPSLLDIANESDDVVIACGDDYPLDGYFAFPEPWRMQADTLSGVKVKPSKRKVSKQHSVEVLHSLLNKHDDVVLLTVGSLTNVAQLIKKYPQDIKRINRLVIMGGAFSAKGNIIVPGFTGDHPNKEAEWNIYVDPVAADIVMAADIPTELVGLDVTNQVKVTSEFVKNFKKSVNTPAAEFWDKVLDDNDWFIDSNEYYFWDVLAALVVTDQQFCVGPKKSVYVEHNISKTPSVWTDSTISKTTSKGEPRQYLEAATAGITRIGGNNPKVIICEQTNAVLAYKEFTATLNGLR